jgi:putative aminopeptidase
MIDKLTDADFQLIKSLVDTPGVSGRESLVAAVIQKSLPVTGWETEVDAIGNLTARKPGPGKKILFMAHMDEVGLIVRRITPDGYLKVERLGGISVHTLLGSALDLWTDSGRLEALVGAEPAHLVNGKSHSTSNHDLFVDIGCSTKDEVFSLGVNIGDALTWKSDLVYLAGRRLRGKALDNRLGCFALIKLAHLLIDEDINADVMLAFVVQEESMILESAPVINKCDPDIVIGVDGTLPFDSPDVQDQQSEISLGKGPCIKLMDAIRGKISYLPNWDLTKAMIRFMEEQALTYQPEIVIGLSTAVSLVPFMNKGIRTAGLSLPIRYHHSAVEVADLRDLESLILLMRLLLVNEIVY